MPSSDQMDSPSGPDAMMHQVLLAPTNAEDMKLREPPTIEALQAELPQYQIVKMLGRGGMGAVYLGRQASLDRRVAIKVLPVYLQYDEANYAERFKNEARAMARLSHPGIVNVFEAGETAGGLLYFVMEFIEGTDVQQMITAHGRLHTDWAMSITAHVCDALACAHEQGIIHRDIKPSNIMVGYDGRTKVADFGLAKMNIGGQTAGLTQSGVTMGTLHYMAPEALILGAAVDHRADIYAVGVMLYHMLTGKLPQGMFELPSIQVPGLDPRYDGIIAKALREDRDLRYGSAAELRQDLNGIVTRPVEKAAVEMPAATAPQAVLPTVARPQRPPGQSQVIVRPPPARSSVLPWLVAASACLAAGWLFIQFRKPEELSRPIVSKPALQRPPNTVSAAAPSEKPGLPKGAPALPPGVSMPAPVPAPSGISRTVPPTKAETPSAAQAPAMTARLEKPAPTPPTPPIPKATASTWVDVQGRTLQAAFVRIEGENIILNIAGRPQTLPVSRLSAESLKIAGDLQAALPSKNALVAGTTGASSNSLPAGLAGLWHQFNDSESVSFFPLAFYADHTAAFGWPGKGMERDGTWSIKGGELTVKWPNGAVYEITLGSLRLGGELEGRGIGSDRSTFSFKLVHSGIRPSSGAPSDKDLAGLRFEFTYQTSSRSGSNGEVLLGKDGKLVWAPLFDVAAWEMVDGMLVFLDSRRRQVSLFNRFDKSGGKWQIEGLYLPEKGDGKQKLVQK